MSAEAPRSAHLSPEQKRALLVRLLEKKGSERKAYPLSFAQARLWILDRLQPGNPSYNVPSALRLPGWLDVSVLERSLNEIVRRHEVLRATFAFVDGKPAQVVAPWIDLKVPVIDLTSTPKNTRESEAARHVFEESRRSFDLACGPLIRAILLKLDDLDHVLVLVVHHIVADGWSIGILHQELASLYAAFSRGQASPLPELPLQYPDFAKWQIDWLSGEVLDRQVSYWKTQLAGLRPLLDLPTDRPRPPVQSHRGDIRSFSLDAELCDKLKALGRSEGATLFMTLLASFQTLLHRLTGETDIAVGSPIANRTRPELEGLIGFFVNTLVMRTDLWGDPTFRQLLGRVRDVALGAYAHQDMPFERLVEEIQPERNLSHNPLFQVMFAVQNIAAPDRSVDAGAAAAPKAPSVANGTAKFDLTLSLFDTGRGAYGFLEYNTDLFERATIDRVLDHYQILLHAISDHPDWRLLSLPIVTETELRELFAGWSGPATVANERTVGEMLVARSAATPSGIALACEKAEITYSELHRRASQIAHRLRALGVRPETPVGLCMERSAEAVVAMLGILKAGGACVPVAPLEPLPRMTSILADASAALVVIHGPERRRIPEDVVRLVCYDELGEEFSADHEPTEAPRAEDLACILYRPGPGPRPRGILMTHHALCRMASEAELNITAADRIALTANFSEDAAVFALFTAIRAGARLVVFPGGPPRKAAELIRDHQVTMLFASLVEVERLSREFPWALRTIRVLLCEQRPTNLKRIREALKPDVLDRLFYLRMAAEAGGYYALQELAALATDVELVPIGCPAAGVSLYLLDANFQPVPEGIPGDLYVGGEFLARGYHGDAAATADVIVPDPFASTPGARMYRTGEVGRRLRDGRIECRRRFDAVEEIEEALCDHVEVHAAAVVAREPGDLRDRTLVAILVGNGAAPSTDELRRHLRERLPEAMIPAAFTMVEELPRTARGEVDRRALLARLDESGAARSAAPPYVAPRNLIEERLANIWMQAFGADRVGVHDSFFRLGGHSLLATQVLARVSDEFQFDLPLQRLFEAPTISELAKVIEPLARAASKPKFPPIAPVPRDKPIPLSFAQQRLWFLDQFEPDSAFYNIAIAVRMPGPLDIRALRDSINDLVQRHESLRTTFDTLDGKPVQIIAPSLEMELSIVDLSELSASAREAEAQRLATIEAQQPFNLKRGPVMRTRLVRFGETDYLFLLTIHHIAADGWSMNVLFRELATLYDAHRVGRQAALPELPIQYADFAGWQRQWLSGAVLEEQLAYWKKQLAGAPAVLELPADRARPAVQVFRGGMHTFRLPVSLIEALKTLCEREQVTLFMALLAGFKALLYRYTSQEDLVVGTPIANRIRPELEPLIGFFANTLVLRTSVSGHLTFRQLVARVREVALGAYSHQDIPFEKLVEELEPQRSLSYNPLFQVMFALQNTGRPPMAGTEPQNTGAPIIGTGVAKFDLTAFLAETAQGIDAGFEFNSDLFDPETAARMADHYEALLRAAVADPDRPVWTLSMLSPAETAALGEWNATEAPYSEECVHSLFESQVQQTPEATAVSFEARTLSYRELNELANFWAQQLIELGIVPDACVGISMERSFEMVIAVLAALKAGASFLPLDPEYPPERIAFMAADARISVILTQECLRAGLAASSVPVLALDVSTTTCADNPLVKVTPDQLAYVIYTSGSTGRPKGVAMPHRPLANLIEFQIARSALPAGARTLQFASLSFDVSFQEIFSTLCSGGTLVLVNDEVRWDPKMLWEMLRTERVSRLFLPYVALQQLAEHSKDAALAPESLCEVITAGEQLNVTPQVAQFFARLNCALYNQYGPSESHVVTEFKLVGPPAEWPALPPIGHPIPNVTIHVLDAFGQPVPVGVPGELFIGGIALARGYIHHSDLTAERFMVDSQFGKGRRLYRTGDRARYLCDGNIQFLGRLDDQLKIRGFRIEPGEIEATLRRHNRVREAAVVARRDGSGEMRLIAYVQTDVKSQELRGFLADLLPDHMIPSGFVLLDALPLTPSGKLDRRALPDALGTIDSGCVFVTPRTPMEVTLARIWCDLLHLDRVGVYDNFFECGGHSLLATRVISRIRDELRVEIPLRLLFEAPTIEALALAMVQISLTEDNEEEAGRLLAEIEQISDEDARTLCESQATG